MEITVAEMKIDKKVSVIQAGRKRMRKLEEKAVKVTQPVKQCISISLQ